MASSRFHPQRYMSLDPVRNYPFIGNKDPTQVMSHYYSKNPHGASRLSGGIQSPFQPPKGVRPSEWGGSGSGSGVDNRPYCIIDGPNCHGHKSGGKSGIQSTQEAEHIASYLSKVLRDVNRSINKYATDSSDLDHALHKFNQAITELGLVATQGTSY
jgi:hypothetical protein